MNNSLDKFKQDILKYFRGVRTEWGKITWPEKNLVIFENCFFVVFVFSLTLFIYFIDIIFDAILKVFTN